MFFQALFNQSLQPAKGFWGRVRRRALYRVRHTLLRVLDPDVEFRFAGIPLRLPLSHALPYYLLDHPGHQGVVARIATAVAAKYPDLHMIDVGANVGDTAAMVRSAIDIPILCVEGSERYGRLLEANVRQMPGVEPVRALLGEVTGRGSVRLQEAGGSGQVVAGTGESALVALPDLLDAHPGFRQAKLLKLDVDGFDVAVLRGAAAWVAHHKPVVFLEYDPSMLARHGETGGALLEVLRTAGYRDVLVFDKWGDFVRTLDLGDQGAIEELDAYFSGRDGRYCDICAFIPEDLDCLEAMRQGELELARPAAIR